MELETKEEIILKKIAYCKYMWKVICDLQNQAWEKGVLFLYKHLSEICESYQVELDLLRSDLCKERGE